MKRTLAGIGCIVACAVFTLTIASYASAQTVERQDTVATIQAVTPPADNDTRRLVGRYIAQLYHAPTTARIAWMDRLQTQSHDQVWLLKFDVTRNGSTESHLGYLECQYAHRVGSENGIVTANTYDLDVTRFAELLPNGAVRSLQRI